jgi:hypothetical protein
VSAVLDQIAYYMNQREINIVSLDIAGNVVVPLRLPPELDFRVCKSFTGTPSFFFVFSSLPLPYMV